MADEVLGKFVSLGGEWVPDTEVAVPDEVVVTHGGAAPAAPTEMWVDLDATGQQGNWADIDSIWAACATGPNSTLMGDDGAMLAAVQGAWPTVAAARYPGLVVAL